MLSCERSPVLQQSQQGEGEFMFSPPDSFILSAKSLNIRERSANISDVWDCTHALGFWLLLK